VKEEVFENPNIRILLVDDNRVNQFLGKRLLKNIGIENVDLCSNGIDALSKISEVKYDVLLTDIEMPGMNGYELSKAVRAKEHSKELLIIALTGNASEEDKAKATESGIDVFITKPYSPEDLLNVLKKYFQNEQPALIEEKTAENICAVKPTLDQLYNIFNHNADDVRHFLMMLSFQIPELEKEMHTGIATSNWQQVFQATHKIKSPLKLFGNTKLVQLLEELSEDARKEIHTASYAPRMNEIHELLEENILLIHETLDGMI
jgi:CheY-like chemotaxis protein/HPt (histidine-containing phosphotransfer) domain-containing protein